MEKYAPEFVDQYESSPALALDIRIVCEEERTYRRTCIGYEDGHCSLYEGKGASFYRGWKYAEAVFQRSLFF